MSFHNIFSAMFSSFLCFLLVILLFKSTPNGSTEVLSSILNCKKAENIHVTSASQGMRRAVGCGFDVNESTMCILNKGSLNRVMNSFVDENVGPRGSQPPNCVFPLSSNGSVFANSVFAATSH